MTLNVEERTLPLEASGEPRSERHEPAPTLVIQPAGRWPTINLRELWAYRELFFFLVWRDIKVRYAQTVLGAVWAILQPVLQMLILTVIFGTFMKVPSDGIPYPIFTLSALVPWTFFSNALTTSSSSLVSNPELISKIYFPRLVIPFAPVMAALLDFVIAFVVLLVMMPFFGVTPHAEAIVIVPLLLVLIVMTAAGVGCWLSALNIQYRDVKQITPLLMKIWMYGSPIIYSLTIVPERFRSFYSLNPMAGVITGFRSVLVGDGVIPWGPVGIAAVVASVLLVTGALYFRRTERIFADVI
ncbi:MAG TPA: ABC transporter permease [Gemmatimonadaceae bacterium]|nr:ABC transporter permease [Gemmatimonadaceae bacterium]